MNTRHCIGASALLLLLTANSFAQISLSSGERGIVISIDGLKTDEGTVACDLFASEAGFPNKPGRAFARARVRPQSRKATCAFPDVKPGIYAVGVWHDTDGDQKLDANLLGIPKEPVGASNNAKGSFGPPKFKAAAFVYAPPIVRKSIRLE